MGVFQVVRQTLGTLHPELQHMNITLCGKCPSGWRQREGKYRSGASAREQQSRESAQPTEQLNSKDGNAACGEEAEPLERSSHCCWESFHSFQKLVPYPLPQQFHFRAYTQQKRMLVSTKAADKNVHSTFIKK